MKPGDDIESDRYLITVEEERAAESAGFQQDVMKGAPALASWRAVPTRRSLGYQPAGLRKKFPVSFPVQDDKPTLVSHIVPRSSELCGYRAPLLLWYFIAQA